MTRAVAKRNVLPHLAGVLTGAMCLLVLSGCGDTATLPPEAGYGPDPQLPEPNKTLLPTLKIAPAQPWAGGAQPVAASGLRVQPFATGLDHPRQILVLPNGDVLVAETNAPPKPDDAKGIRGFVQKLVMKHAGAVTPSANRIALLRDTDGDGIADQHFVFAQNLQSPYGMALVGDTLYVADTDALVKFAYKPGDTQAEGTPQKVVDLPGGTLNHHWTKSLVASADGQHLYVGVGSNSNVAENGMDKEEGRAAVWEIDPQTGTHRVYASGLRNPAGLTIEPSTHQLWASVNERDEIGSDLVPDYMTSVKDGGFYGWPYSYYGNHVDVRVEPQDPQKVAAAIKPDYALGAHTASLGLCAAQGSKLPQLEQGMFVGQHGSWNRNPRSGYKVLFVPFANGKPDGAPRDVLTGFLDADGHARGRPVGVAIDSRGALLVADDVGNTVWRVSPATDGAPAVAAR